MSVLQQGLLQNLSLILEMLSKRFFCFPYNTASGKQSGARYQPVF